MEARAPEAHFSSARKAFHALLRDKVLRLESGVPSNADKGNTASKDIALGIFKRIGLETAGLKLKGQTAGSEFEVATASFVHETFVKLNHLRPGDWVVKKIGGKDQERETKKQATKDFKKLVKIAQFEQYRHLIAIAKAASENAELAASIGSDYIIKPDVVIFRLPVEDEEINRKELLVDDAVAQLASLRKKNGGAPLLHASLMQAYHPK